LRNTRKTERGAGVLLTDLEVRAAPFALGLEFPESGLWGIGGSIQRFESAKVASKEPLLRCRVVNKLGGRLQRHKFVAAPGGLFL
jgi:hypothetical protein